MSTDSCVSEMAHSTHFQAQELEKTDFHRVHSDSLLCGSLSPSTTIISPSDSSPSYTLPTSVLLHLAQRGKKLMNLRVSLMDWPSYSG